MTFLQGDVDDLRIPCPIPGCNRYFTKSCNLANHMVFYKSHDDDLAFSKKQKSLKTDERIHNKGANSRNNYSYITKMHAVSLYELTGEDALSPNMCC